MENDLEKVLLEYPELFRLQEGGKIKCRLSGHEMPARLDAVRAYVNGKKFIKLKAAADLNYKGLEPLIIPSQKRKHQLFCCLTNRYIGRQLAYIEKHTAGHRYKKALAKYNKGELSLFKEFGGKGARQGAASTAGVVPAAVDDEMSCDQPAALDDVSCDQPADVSCGGPSSPLSSEHGDPEGEGVHLAEHVSMDVEEDLPPKKPKLRRTKMEEEGRKKGKTPNSGGTKNPKLKNKPSKTPAAVIEPGDDTHTHKRTRTKGNSSVKRAKLVSVS